MQYKELQCSLKHPGVARAEGKGGGERFAIPQHIVTFIIISILLRQVCRKLTLDSLSVTRD